VVGLKARCSAAVGLYSFKQDGRTAHGERRTAHGKTNKDGATGKIDADFVLRYFSGMKNVSMYCFP
jgi:hypothetical protein